MITNGKILAEDLKNVNLPLDKTDSLLIVADNNRAVGRLTESANDYKTLLAAGQTYNDDVKCQINHGLGQLYSKQKIIIKL